MIEIPKIPKREGPWLGRAIAGMIEKARRDNGGPGTVEAPLYEYLNIGTARMIVLDRRQTVEANEFAYGELAAVEALCDIQDPASLPCWIEYDPRHRDEWYARPENVGTGRMGGAVPERTGILVRLDARGRISVDHAYVRDGAIEFCLMTCAINAKGATPPDGEYRMIGVPGRRATMSDDETAGKIAFMQRLSCAPTRYAETLAELRATKAHATGGMSVMQVALRGAAEDAEAETNFGLGALCLMARPTGRH